MALMGGAPGRASGEIYVSLRERERRAGGGHAFPDNVGFGVNLPNRGSFSPDAAFYTGELKGGQSSMERRSSVEVRSENDYGSTAERAMADKRADHFAAGTLVVWDVLREHLARVYRASNPEHPTTCLRGDIAEAGPAVRGWSMPVDGLL
jgi:Uma2 family endonuclease